jgi:hypothetical protein
MDDASVVRSFDLTNHEGFFLAAFVCMLGNMFLSFYVVFWLAKLDLRQTTPAECADALNRAVVLELGATLLPALLFLAGSYVNDLHRCCLVSWFFFFSRLVNQSSSSS